jgi:hypothetical protein
LSKNVRFDLNSSLASETLANLKSVYSEKEAFYLLVLPASFQVYCFDTKQSLQDGASRVTKWDSIAPTALRSLRNGDLYIGKNGYIGKYGTYLDDTTTYRFAYYTNNADLGNPNQISILKTVTAIVIGGSDQFLSINWGFDYSGAYRAENCQGATKLAREGQALIKKAMDGASANSGRMSFEDKKLLDAGTVKMTESKKLQSQYNRERELITYPNGRK